MSHVLIHRFRGYFSATICPAGKAITLSGSVSTLFGCRKIVAPPRTSTGQPVQFNSPDDVKGGYAILSHVWQQPEMSFQELQALHSSSQPSSSHDTVLALASPKIRECCRLAESHGYQWLWIDNCCIDRSSSAELFEAVNSMVAWYSRAHVCYAYLNDVPSSNSLNQREPTFWTSKWFSRGWTLQDPIAWLRLLSFGYSAVAALWTQPLRAGSASPATASATNGCTGAHAARGTTVFAYDPRIVGRTAFDAEAKIGQTLYRKTSWRLAWPSTFNNSLTSCG